MCSAESMIQTFACFLGVSISLNIFQFFLAMWRIRDCDNRVESAEVYGDRAWDKFAEIAKENYWLRNGREMRDDFPNAFPAASEQVPFEVVPE